MGTAGKKEKIVECPETRKAKAFEWARRSRKKKQEDAEKEKGEGFRVGTAKYNNKGTGGVIC